GYKYAFFVRADTPEVLRNGLAALSRADLLNLEERRTEDEMVHVVLGWLKANPSWLLILDNVDTPEAESAVLSLLPRLTGGRVLITSRLQSWPVWIQTQSLDTVPLEEARDFLLARTNGRRRPAPDDSDRARDLAEKLDGLPLALEHAGAYIAHTRLSFAKYLKVWEEERQEILEWHDEAVMGYPASVATTWKASFDRLKSTSVALLRLCAFLAPEPIPEEMFETEKDIVEGACELLRFETGHGDVGSIHKALAELESYSLISRQERTFTVHRMVQEVLQSRIPPERRRDWIEAALKVVNGYAPFDAADVRTWPVWNILRPHAARIILLADDLELVNPTARLMSQLALFLKRRGLYAEAEPLQRRALAIDEASFGSQHPEVAIDLNNLAQVLQDTNRLSEAEPLMRRALAIDEASFGSEHSTVAIRLSNLAGLLHATNRHAEAEPLMRRALAIDEASFGSEHPRVAIRLNNLAQLLQATNRLSEAEPLMRRTLAIDEASLGSEHPNVARDLNNLARLLQATNRLSEAEPLMRSAVATLERSLGPDHPRTQLVQRNLAKLLAAIANQSPPPPAPEGGDSV
ncbi:MAG TPA: tetratricopeptide repeat protein, partial [Thermoanaerobaculia bacterium]|nr:tetratricopeptide repeat protein [Thermoanaerobaculia bacterium]